MSNSNDHTDSRSVDADAFREAIAPTVAVLREFSSAVDQLAKRYGGQPSAESRAMSEISAEHGYATRSSRKLPITETHGFGALTLRAASDYVRTFAEAFAGERMPVWGHLVIARSALEASVIAWWLSEPGIGPLERIKRGLCEQLYSAEEVRKLKIRDDALADVDQLKSDAAAFGWEARFDRGRPVVDGDKRPSVPDGIRTLLERDEGATIGNLLWSRLSAVSHVTWFGVSWALSLSDAAASNVLTGGAGIATVPIATDLPQVSVQALSILRALRNAATARFTLMGWSDPQWHEACSRAEECELRLLVAATPRTSSS